MQRTTKRVIRSVAIAGATASATVAFGQAAWRWYRAGKPTRDETQRSLPGDNVIPEPATTTRCATTVTATPEQIWPWIAQIGYQRGGFYSYDWIERRMGLRIESVERILPQFQNLKAGDVIPFGPEGPNVPVYAIEPNAYLVLGGYDSLGGAIWSLALYPLDETHTRLVTATKARWPHWTLRTIVSREPPEPGMPRPSLLANLTMRIFFHPGAYLMSRKMLSGIKRRAEAYATQPAEKPAPERTTKEPVTIPVTAR